MVLDCGGGGARPLLYFLDPTILCIMLCQHLCTYTRFMLKINLRIQTHYITILDIYSREVHTLYCGMVEFLCIWYFVRYFPCMVPS